MLDTLCALHPVSFKRRGGGIKGEKETITPLFQIRYNACNFVFKTEHPGKRLTFVTVFYVSKRESEILSYSVILVK